MVKEFLEEAKVPSRLPPPRTDESYSGAARESWDRIRWRDAIHSYWGQSRSWEAEIVGETSSQHN